MSSSLLRDAHFAFAAVADAQPFSATSSQANIGELDIRETRRGLVLGQLSLLQMQALAVSFLAGILSFLLGLTLPHRISDEELASVNATAALLANGSSLLASAPRDLAIVAAMFLGERADPDEGYIDSFKEGFTPPGGKELMIVLVTGMVAASLSSGILGSFMSGLVVLSRRLRINPGECRSTSGRRHPVTVAAS